MFFAMALVTSLALGLDNKYYATKMGNTFKVFHKIDTVT